MERMLAAEIKLTMSLTSISSICSFCILVIESAALHCMSVSQRFILQSLKRAAAEPPPAAPKPPQNPPTAPQHEEPDLWRISS